MVFKSIKEYLYKVIQKIKSIVSRRNYLSKRYIRGEGLEIGALHFPLPLPKGVVVKNIDLVSREENIKRFPELNASEIVVTDCIDDGFNLSTIPEESQGFLIANHVLEHAPNPIQVLINWTKVLKRNGIFFITVPIGEKCFDKGRPLTSLQHIIDDFELYKQSSQEVINEQNKTHYREWITISEPNIYKKQNDNYVYPSQSELNRRIDEAALNHLEIHFHTFSEESFKELLYYFVTEIKKNVIVETIKNNGSEIISILRKTY